MTKKKTGGGRDWGQGFACQGRTKECTTVPRNHFGPIPGIEVGMSWLQRIQVRVVHLDVEEWSEELLTPALLCHKEPARASKAPY